MILKKISGITLVENIVAISILSILVVAFSFVFNNSIKNISSAGEEVNYYYQLQKEIEETIAYEKTEGTDSMEIFFDEYKIQVNGKYIILDENMEIFTPNK
ncbi:type II secretion system protein [Herbivorax sp. ANBcel31]|uniref:type IV pilus modification PilV family protein n=1 Tax=Herbivorax sp. ANBcel31 TaxID=3069754 RepID=UPI0027B81C08|nr:type II secretion system protein [Herbivorax sp. ANBcel31]MDQ2087829.1 type II secretion system protein [Herbivorax sp. ANBcel31]